MKMLYFLSFVLISALSLNAQEQSPACVVGQALENTAFVTQRKPDTSAQYYMFLHSASWCGPCRKTLPKIIAEYAEMRRDNRLEIILISHDYTLEKAQRYVAEAAVPFAALWYRGQERKAIPGAAENVIGIPCIIVTDAAGKVVHRGHASSFIHWKTFTSKQ